MTRLIMSNLILVEGALFNGRYRIVRCLAMGGMGAVYEAIHLETERRRALKVMLPHLVQSEELRNRFRQEARVAAHIESEFIVDVFDTGVDDTTQMPFLVMEFLKGEELGKRLKRVGRFSPAEVVTYLQQTAIALDKTHQASIVHRDLKPENLFLTQCEDGQPRIKVLDFGVAKVIAEGATSGGATRSLGTPLYMSPEQFNPDSRLTGAADIYALVMIAYTLLVGAPYWSLESKASSSVFTFAMKAVYGPPAPASVRATLEGVTLPQAFDAWFARGTAVDPVYRFSTALDTVNKLAEALGLPLSRASFSLEQRETMMSGISQGGQVKAEASQNGMLQAEMMTDGLSTPNGTVITGGIPERNSAWFAMLAATIGVAVIGAGGGVFVLLRSPKAPPSMLAAVETAAPGTPPVQQTINAAPASEPAPAIAAPANFAVLSAIPSASASGAVSVPSPKSPAKAIKPALSKKSPSPSYGQD